MGCTGNASDPASRAHPPQVPCIACPTREAPNACFVWDSTWRNPPHPPSRRPPATHCRATRLGSSTPFPLRYLPAETCGAACFARGRLPARAQTTRFPSPPPASHGPRASLRPVFGSYSPWQHPSLCGLPLCGTLACFAWGEALAACQTIPSAPRQQTLAHTHTHAHAHVHAHTHAHTQTHTHEHTHTHPPPKLIPGIQNLVGTGAPLGPQGAFHDAPWALWVLLELTLRG